MPVSASCAMLAMLWHPELWVTFAWLREVIGCFLILVLEKLVINLISIKISHQSSPTSKFRLHPRSPHPWTRTSRIAPLGNGAEVDSCSWKAHHADLMCKKLGFDVQTS
jgi:hypothetical protein